MGYPSTALKPLGTLHFSLPERTFFTQAIETYGKKLFRDPINPQLFHLIGRAQSRYHFSRFSASQMKESKDEQSNAGKILSEKTAVDERATSPLAADVSRSVRTDQKRDSEV